MYVVPEAAIGDLVSPEDAFAAVEEVFAAMARGEAANFPVVREAIGHAGALWGFKSGFDRAGLVLGMKAGGYWPGNAERGLTNHQSTVFLFDPDTGRVAATVGGNLLTALRTAAASAVSIRHLARPESRVLGMLGAGHQSAYQMRAAVAAHPFERIVGWNLHPEMLGRLAETAEDLGLPFEAVGLDGLGEADVIVTITSSPEPTLMSAHVRPGTHLACMGTDTKGKQEVEAALLGRATVFADEIAQSTSLGEAQHAVAEGIIDAGAITAIGDVIAGTHPGRTSPDEITLFDGTGVGLQDLAVAAAALARARERGVGSEVEV